MYMISHFDTLVGWLAGTSKHRRTVASSIHEEVYPACGLALQSLPAHRRPCCSHAQPELVTLRSSRVQRVSRHPHLQRKTDPVRDGGWGMGSQPTHRLEMAVRASVLWVSVVSSHRTGRHYYYSRLIVAAWSSSSQNAPVITT